MSHHNEFSRGDTGINTVEGNLAGHRAAQLTKKREQAQQVGSDDGDERIGDGCVSLD